MYEWDLGNVIKIDLNCNKFSNLIEEIERMLFMNKVI